METKRTQEERLKGSILMLNHFTEKYMVTYKPGVEKYIDIIDLLSDLVMMDNAKMNAVINCDETAHLHSVISGLKMQIINKLSKGL